MCPTRFSLPDASFKLSVGLYCNQRTDAQPRFLTDKDAVFQTDFSIYYLLTLLPSAHIIAGWLLRYTPHRLYCLSAQATLTCPEHGFIFEG